MWIKKIPRFPGYAVTKDGRVWSMSRKLTDGREWYGRWLKPTTNKDGYLVVHLCKNSRSYTRHIHRLVLETYTGLCPSEMQCRHLNGNPGDNRLDNLCWGTCSNNFQDSVRLGVINRKGEKAHNVKLTEQDVRMIVYMHRTGLFTQYEIAKEYKVTQGTISLILLKKTWKHLWAKVA